MDREFADQIAVVTGAVSGLGLVIAKRLYSGGAKVAMLDLNESTLHSTIASRRQVMTDTTIQPE